MLEVVKQIAKHREGAIFPLKQKAGCCLHVHAVQAEKQSMLLELIAANFLVKPMRPLSFPVLSLQHPESFLTYMFSKQGMQNNMAQSTWRQDSEKPKIGTSVGKVK